MGIRAVPFHILSVPLVALLAAACAPNDDSAAARKAIEEIDAAIDAAGDPAIKYIPGKVAAANGQATQLKIRFFDRDYQGIVDAAPAILGQAQGLSSAAKARKAEIAQVLEREWTALVTAVPATIARAEKYVDGVLASRKLPPGVNEAMLESARVGIAEQKAQWEKGLAARAAGDLEQAVTIGVHTQRRLENLIAALGGDSAG